MTPCTCLLDSDTGELLSPNTTCPEHGAHGVGHSPVHPTLGASWNVGKTLLRPLALEPWMIDPRKIAHSLARLCRFGGLCEGFVPVAFHSVNVLIYLREHHGGQDLKLLRTGLMHDAPEGLGLVDMIRPIKRMPQMLPYNTWHDDAWHPIAAKLDLYDPIPRLVHEADDAVLAIELEEFDNPAYGMDYRPAKRWFLQHWDEVAP